MFAAIGRTSQTAVSRLSRVPKLTQKPKIILMAPTTKRNASKQQYWVPEGYREDISKGAMLRFEDSLPRLPVPTLEETSTRYLKSIHPLLNKDEYAASEKAVAAFQK
jgi:carnitine O-acetyltransferase